MENLNNNTLKNHKLCLAKVFHSRLFPKQNTFLYKAFYLLLDIEHFEKLSSKFLSFNKFNFFSFYEKDHKNHYPQGFEGSLKDWIYNILAKENIVPDKIKLMCHPRNFGYVFNPVSFWFCLDKNDRLIAVLAAVNNTFGESHSYLIFNANQAPITANQEHFAKKEFHVSPFFKRQGKYGFKFDYNPKKIIVFIDYFDEDKLMLKTSVTANIEDLGDIKLIKAFFAIPFLTFKVIFLIHFQALKIILKGIKYIKKPAQFYHKITKTNE